MIANEHIHYRLPTKLREGNVFTGVSVHSVQGGGVHHMHHGIGGVPHLGYPTPSGMPKPLDTLPPGIPYRLLLVASDGDSWRPVQTCS